MNDVTEHSSSFVCTIEEDPGAQTHHLKTWVQYFAALWSGEKTFEVRYNDRGYQRGDVLVLREWSRDGCTCAAVPPHESNCGGYTGRTVTARVGYVLASTPPRGSQKGFDGNGYVVLALVDQLRDHPARLSTGAAMAQVAGRPTNPSDTTGETP